VVERHAQRALLAEGLRPGAAARDQVRAHGAHRRHARGQFDAFSGEADGFAHAGEKSQFDVHSFSVVVRRRG
jgi:hypothetical protein